MPAIVFNTYTGGAYGSDGILRAVTGKGKRLWDATEAAARTVPGASIAIGELDPASPGPEIATCSTDQKLLVFSAAGKVLWKSTDAKIVCNYGGPQLGDVNGDGTPELLVRYTVVDAKTHGVIFQGRTSTYPYPTADYSTFADIDMDGDLDIVGGNVVYRNDGASKFSTLWDGSKFATPMPDGYVAVADLDMNGEPDIVSVHSLEQSTAQIRALRAKDGTALWGPFSTNPAGGTDTGGGPPTVADFDGDGKPDVAMAGGYSYNVYDGATGTLKWRTTTTDRSSRVTGSSVFDFDGDGKAEVVYADERNLHVYEGPTGKELLTLCNPSGTLWEYPLVADVDGDDQAEIVLVANDMWWGCGAGLGARTGPTGLRVIGSKSGAWVRTRRIWNQHTYHVTNVNDDATIPAKEIANWTVKKLNNFRQNVQPRGVFDAANAVVEVEGSCTTPALLRARVRNVGIATLPAGVVVGFYEGDPAGTPTRIGTAKTTTAILPGGFETVELKWDPAPSGYYAGTVSVFAKVADEGTPESIHQCKTSDDTSKVFKNKCTG
ncbi:MAG: VCBS repeat-containing protein [Deltaproteobacteria bacterium]|nr:VCBS repeat-containing protein [Deltaproteobacteria bacterium]